MDEVINPSSNEGSILNDIPSSTGSQDLFSGNKVSPEPQKAAYDPEQTVPITWKGETTAVPLSKLKNHYQLRHDLEQNQRSFKEERAKFEAERGDLNKYNEYKQKYEAVDQYAIQNPDWWNYVQEQFQQRGTFGLQKDQTIPEPVRNTISALNKELGDLKNELGEFRTWKQEAQLAKDVQEIETEFKGVSSSFKNVDFLTPDDSGVNLKSKVLQHGAEHGFPTFKSAFLDFYSDNLFKQAQETGMKSATESIQKSKDAGIVNMGNQRKVAQPKSVDLRKTYGEIAEEIKREINR